MLRRPRKDAAAGRTAVEWPAESSETHLISDSLAVRLTRHATCPRCGTRRMPGTRFCATCGLDLDADQAGPSIRSWVGRRAAIAQDPRAVAPRSLDRWLAADESAEAAPNPDARLIVGEGLIALTGRQMLALGLGVGVCAGVLATILGQ